MAAIARVAGVHHTTVSLALRDHPSLPAGTRTRIQSLATSMGYRVDSTLHALTTYRHPSGPAPRATYLALVTSGPTRFGWRHLPAHKPFFRGVKARATELGYHLTHLWLDEPGRDTTQLTAFLVEHGIKGLLLTSHDSPNHRALQFDRRQFCAVQIEHRPGPTAISRVSNDHPAAVHTAIDHARRAGYRRIGLVLPRPWDHLADSAWTLGYLATQLSIDPRERVPALLFDDHPAARHDGVPVVPLDALEAWLNQHEVDAVMSHAPAVEPALAALGQTIPRDLGLVDIFLRDADRGRIAGVRQECEQVGALAVDLLHQQLLGAHDFSLLPAVQTRVQGRWMDGASLPVARVG